MSAASSSRWLDGLAAALCADACSGCAPARERPASPEVDRATAALERLLDEFDARHGGRTPIEAARDAFQALAEIPRILRWDTGLRPAVQDLILATIAQAERFGDGTGAYKRRFSIDVITRVLRVYDESGLIEPVEDVVVAPFVGIEIDWMVQVLNIHDAWPPAQQVSLPRFFDGRHGRLLRFLVGLWRLWVRLGEWLLLPTPYERHLRHARTQVDAQVRALYAVLPPASWHQTTELLVNVVVKFGNLTAPHIATVDQVLRLLADIDRLSLEERREVAFRAVRLVLRRAYADDRIALALIDSTVGQFLVRQMVFSTEWVLRRNNLLPRRLL